MSRFLRFLVSKLNYLDKYIYSFVITDVCMYLCAGDVFESLIGAIYIDSGHNLETVWNVFERVFKHLDRVMRDPPKNAKKELLEKYPGQGEVNIATEPPSAFEENVKAVVTVVKNNKSQTFKGLGRNKVSAELAACKFALRGIMK